MAQPHTKPSSNLKFAPGSRPDHSAASAGRADKTRGDIECATGRAPASQFGTVTGDA